MFMVARNKEICHKEHLLAKKAEDILEHQQDLTALRNKKNRLKNKKPTTQQDQLTYEESLEFGERMNQYKRRLNEVEIQIQKLCRELNALRLQAEKLLPVSEVKVRVSTHPEDGSPVKTFCVEHVKTNEEPQPRGYFKIEQL